MSRSGRWTVPTSSVSPDGARRPPGPRSERFSLPEDRARCAAAITRSGGCHYQGARSTERNGTVTPITIFITPWSPPIIIGDLVSHRSCGKIFVLSQLFGERRWRTGKREGGEIESDLKPVCFRCSWFWSVSKLAIYCRFKINWI